MPYESSVFGVFAHTVISVVSFVIQTMGLRTKMENNKVKNSKNIKQILFFPLVIQSALHCTYIGCQGSTQCVSCPYLQLSPQSHLTFLWLTTFSSCCNKTYITFNCLAEVLIHTSYYILIILTCIH